MITEAEAMTILEKVGLPTYGTHDERVERIKQNDLMPTLSEAQQEKVSDLTDKTEQFKKRGRPAKAE